jgi:hypothetical protein
MGERVDRFRSDTLIVPHGRLGIDVTPSAESRAAAKATRTAYPLQHGEALRFSACTSHAFACMAFLSASGASLRSDAETMKWLTPDDRPM